MFGIEFSITKHVEDLISKITDSPNWLMAIFVASCLSLLAHIAAGDGASSMMAARRLFKLREVVRKQPIDASDVRDVDSARRELARLRHELLDLGDCSAQYFALRWSPWGTVVGIIHGLLSSILDIIGQ